MKNDPDVTASTFPPDAASQTDPHGPSQARTGLLFGLAAYLAWGFVPLYFKLLVHVPPEVVVAHRVVWTLVFVSLLLTFQRRWGEVRQDISSRRTRAALCASGALVATNWLIFVWAVAHDQVLQASLGYYINPLFAVALGMVFLRERLRPGQSIALALAAVGVANQIVQVGQVPVVALSLAVTFSFYGLLRKVTPVKPLVGLYVETAFLLPFAVLFIVAMPQRNLGYGTGTLGLLGLAGVVTALPLLWFAAAARRLRLATVGFLQYVGPTVQFLLAVGVFGEVFTLAHAVTFACIWCALLVYSVDSLWGMRTPKVAVLAPAPE